MRVIPVQSVSVASTVLLSVSLNFVLVKYKANSKIQCAERGKQDYVFEEVNPSLKLIAPLTPEKYCIYVLDSINRYWYVSVVCKQRFDKMGR